MNKPLYFVGPWDLNTSLACLPEEPGRGRVLLVESIAKGSALPYHRQKLVLVLSAMHHFKQRLQAQGYEVELRRAGSYVEGIAAAVDEHQPGEVIAMMPREWGMQEALEQAQREDRFGVPLTLRDDGGEGGHFLLTRQEFADWAEGRKSLRMDSFYRWMRKRTGYLMEDGKPVGGQWSFDEDNRQVPGQQERPPQVPHLVPDALTAQIIERVEGWEGHWGSARGFDWPVTRAQALAELEDFLEHRAGRFGDFEDAMLHGQRWLWHARLSVAMNLSLLQPAEVIEAALEAHRAGVMPINAAEGFLRQILGWREFIRGAYWLQMPGLREANLLDAQRPLPRLYWEPQATEMCCMRDCVESVREHGYAHHIPRLMVLGNFALLAGLRPIEVSHWFWAGFVDAYEWVELPNVHNMALFASDRLTTKPYAASANYIHKMSDYCADCRYDRKARTGADACPFNHMFWSFMARHRERLEQNVRLKMLYRTWDRWDAAQQRAILESTESFLQTLEPAEHGWSFEEDAC